jgi:ADP-ribosylation factor-like protein 8
MEQNTIFTFGLDRAGKTVMLNYFVTGAVIKTFRPTLAINYSKLMMADLTMRFADAPGQKACRKLWNSGLKGTQLLIFVLDTSDHLRFEEAKSELLKVLNNPETKEVPLLFLYNKMDLQEAKDNLEFAKSFFQIEELKNKVVHYFNTSIEDKNSLNIVKDTIYNFIKKRFQL